MHFFGLVILLTFWNSSHAGDETALFFDWEEEKLVEINRNYGEATCKSCISACPTDWDSPLEEELTIGASITQKIVILRAVYSKSMVAKDMEIEICQKYFTPAMAFNYRLNSYDVGYELYYEEESIESKQSSFMYDYYAPVFNGESKPDWKQVNEDTIKISRSSENLSIEIDVDQKKNLVIDAKSEIGKNGKTAGIKINTHPVKKWLFYWINVLSFYVPIGEKLRIVTFTADNINDYFHTVGTFHYCETYFTEDGVEIENSINVVEIQTVDAEPQIEAESKKIFGRLVKAQIIPMLMFHTLAARRATCTYLNLAYIWETIANEQLKKVDSFVYAIYREWPSEMSMSFGISGDSQELDPAIREKLAPEDFYATFPIPEVIHRFIEITAIDKKTYGAVIVIHNKLESVKDTERICSTADEVEGWEDIKNTDSVTGFSYVCPQTQKVLMKLGLDEKTATVNMEPLNLKQFPQIEYKTLLDKINRRLDDIKKMNYSESSAEIKKSYVNIGLYF